MNFHDLVKRSVRNIAELEENRKWHSNIVDIPIIIVAFEPRDTSNGIAYLTSLFMVDDNLTEQSEPVKVNMGASVIINQLEEFKDDLPLACRVTKETNKSGSREYYLLTSWSQEELDVFLSEDFPLAPDDIPV